MKGGLDQAVAAAIAAGKCPDGMKADEAALYDLATALYRERKVSDSAYKAAFEQFGERGIMDMIGIIGFYDIMSMTLIAMRAGVPDGKPLPAHAFVKLSDLAAFPIVTYAPESNIGRPIRDIFRSLGLTLQDQVIINDAPTGFQLPRMGIGPALVGHLASGDTGMPSVVIRPISPAIPVPVVLLTRPDRALSQNARQMVELLRHIRHWLPSNGSTGAIPA